jgi:hypothetical protein
VSAASGARDAVDAERPRRGRAISRHVAARRLLWSDLAPLARRARKTEDAFRAIALALARNRPLSGDDARAFLALHDVFGALATAQRERLWRDP